MKELRLHPIRGISTSPCGNAEHSTKTRRELLASLKPKDWQYLRADNGDMPVDYVPESRAAAVAAHQGVSA